MIILMRSIKTECVEQAEKLWLKTKMTMQNIETPNTHARRYRCTEKLLGNSMTDHLTSITLTKNRCANQLYLHIVFILLKGLILFSC